MSSEDQNVLTHIKKLGNSEFAIYCKSLPETANLIYNIQKYLVNQDPFYWNSILIISKGRTLQTLVKRLQSEYNNLISQKSFLHLITRALQSRQKCLQKIKRQLSKVSSVLKIFKKVYFKPGNASDLAYLDYVHQDGYTAVQVDESIQNSIQLINQIFINMARLRDMTIYIIETVHNWKQQLQQWSDKCNQYKQVFFIKDKKNVYQTILKDSSFIWESQLSGYIWMQFKNDPFLIRNVLQVQQRQEKEILQKYFLQMLYPKSDQIVTKALKCFEMLNFKYEIKIQNLYAEQQLLIESYLNLQKKQNQQNGIKINQKNINSIQLYDQKVLDKKNQLKNNAKGWIFGNLMQKPSRERIQSVIQNHQHRISLIKPFSISNYSQRKSLALAFLNNVKNLKKFQEHKLQNNKNKQAFVAIKNKEPLKYKFLKKGQVQHSDHQKGYRSQNDIQKNLIKTNKKEQKHNQVIIQDPHEDQPETPKKINKLKKMEISQKSIKCHTHSLSKSKINTFQQETQLKKNQIPIHNYFDYQNKNKFIVPINEKYNSNHNLNALQSQMIPNKMSPILIQNQNERIDVQKEDNPLNFSQFLKTFRADTSKKIHKIQDEQIKKSKFNQNQQKLTHVRQLILTHRKKKGKSLVHLNRKTFSRQKLINSQLALNLSPYLKNSFLNKNKPSKKNNSSILSQAAINQYEQIKFNNKNNTASSPNISQQSFKQFQIDQFIILKPKTIPVDTLSMYLRHIFNQQHSTSKKFTIYNMESLYKKMSDPLIHCLIFDIYTQKRGHIGQAILIQNFGASQKLKYTLQFINVNIFQLIVISILRIIQQLLSTTPCDQVICPLYLDKLDHVSVHFVHLIEEIFRQKVKSFGQLHIFQKKSFYFQGSDINQRLNVFSCKKNKSEGKLTKNLMGNYRSLKFECKCLVLTSNFRLRGKTTAKDVVSNYLKASIGNLYSKILQKILTKYHLKQIRTATLSLSQQDETVNLIKQNTFLRSLIQSLSGHLKQNKQERVRITRFQAMNELISYLDYKQYSKQFYFAPLHQSRFILNHQLYLAELQIQLSLEFMIKMSVDFIILYNNRDLTIKEIGHDNQAYLLPTTQSEIKLLLMNGKKYQQCIQKLDLFSYLFMLINQNKNDIIDIKDVKQIVFPNIQKSKTMFSGVKMFDAFFRLFPERQFYSGTYLKISNLWESYFPSAIIVNPSQNAIIFQKSFIIGFYSQTTKEVLSAFLIKNQ